jgi:NhaA family Na+:H+ antiporter
MASRTRRIVREFIDSETAGGLVLMASAALALIVANSPLAAGYFALLGHHAFGLSLLDWINDAPMALFFLLVGLEIKRELAVGRLASWRARALPGFGALGGMIVPALIFVAINTGSPATLRGWAIPTATDIAFALGVLALLGSRVPLSLKVFLTALAILDDLGAVIIIAVFYTADISPMMIGLAALTVAVLVGMNASGVVRLVPYLVLGAALWFFVFSSGVHATIAGVLLAATIPVKGAWGDAGSPLERLERALARWVAFLVLPIFGFANAGVSLAGTTIGGLANPVTLGTALGLFLGKQAGVFAGVWLSVWARLAVRPAGASWAQTYAVALLCGIGFTMSLFIGLLAFDAEALVNDAKIGVLAGSLLSAIAGWIVLRATTTPPPGRGADAPD